MFKIPKRMTLIGDNWRQSTVFPRIVSAETILFRIQPYVLCPLVTVHTGAETIQGRKLFAEIR